MDPVGLLIGHSWPEIVVWIMPCPVASASIVAYSGYTRKNRLLLGLMALWGLTGIKAFFFDAMDVWRVLSVDVDYGVEKTSKR